MSEGGLSPEEMGLTEKDMQTSVETAEIPPEEQLFQEIMALPNRNKYDKIASPDARVRGKITVLLEQHPELQRNESIAQWLQESRISGLVVSRDPVARRRQIKSGILKEVVTYASVYPDKFGGSDKVIHEANDYRAILSGRRTIIDRTGRRAVSRHLDGGTVGKLVEKIATSPSPQR